MDDFFDIFDGTPERFLPNPSLNDYAFNAGLRKSHIDSNDITFMSHLGDETIMVVRCRNCKGKTQYVLASFDGQQCTNAAAYTTTVTAFLAFSAIVDATQEERAQRQVDEQSNDRDIYKHGL